MALTPQSIRSNVIIKLNDEYVKKEEQDIPTIDVTPEGVM